MPLTIRQAGYDDLPAAAAMETKAWRQSYQGLLGPSLFEDLEGHVGDIADHWAELMEGGHYFWIVVDQEAKEVVGIAHAGPARDADAPTPLELTTLYLLEEAKGTGVAQALMRMAIGDSPAYLWVLDGNERAINFYTREGFFADGGRREMPNMDGAVELRMVRGAIESD